MIIIFLVSRPAESPQASWFSFSCCIPSYLAYGTLEMCMRTLQSKMLLLLVACIN